MDLHEEVEQLRQTVLDWEFYGQSCCMWPRRLFDILFAIIDKLEEKA